MKTPKTLSRLDLLATVRKTVPSHLFVTRVNRDLKRPSRAKQSSQLRRELIAS